MSKTVAPGILVLRRDNMGDPVCATPPTHALRGYFPRSRLCVPVNGRSRPVAGAEFFRTRQEFARKRGVGWHAS